MNTTPRRRGVANKCAPHIIRSDTLMSVVREGALAPQLDTTLSTVSNGNGGRLRIAKHHNLAFFRTLRNNPGPDRRRLLNEQFPSRIAWTDGRWKAIMTAWHYTMQKSKTLRWLRSMQARHSPTTHILSPVKDTQVIYALYHIDLPRRIYVGQTITTAFERFQRHVGNARRIFKTGDNGWTEPLHRHMAFVGWQGFRIFPLEKIPGEFANTKSDRAKFRQIALKRETFWKRVLHAFLPTGFCLEGKKPKRLRTPRNARAGPTDLTGTPETLSNDNTTRTCASRDYERKVRYLLNSACNDRFNPTVLGSHATRNVRRMYDCLNEYSPEHWDVEQRHYDTVSQALLGCLTQPVRPERCQTVIVQLFLHRNIERLGINTVIADDEAWSTLVPAATQERLKRPMLAYKYAAPVSRSFCNYTSVSNLSPEEVGQILTRPCQCRNPSFRAYQDEHTGHVITTDTSIMRNDRLQYLMSKGTKFRCTVAESDLTEGGSVQEVVLNDLKRALRTWMKGVETRFGKADASAVTNWKNSILIRVEELLRDQNVLNATPPGNPLPSENDLQQLYYIKRHFVITTVDKAENNFCIMCKKHYLLKCLEELEQGVAYRATERSENDILLSCQQFDDQFNRSMTETGGGTTPVDDTLQMNPAKIPNFHIRVKMHKEPLGFRFVAGSRDAPLTNVSKWLTLVLKACQPVVHDLWRSQARKVPGTCQTQHDLTSWIIKDSEEISQLCRSVNKSRGSRDPIPLAAYDFTTMYTKLCLSDLKDRMTSLIRQIFQFKHDTSRARILLVDQFGHHEWIVSPRSDLTGNSRMFDENKIIEAISFLVDNTFVRFAGRLWHQIVGIPMGTNCAGFLANLYCFTYEFDFLQRVVNERNWTLAREMLRTKRYIDDLIIINGELLPRRLYLPEGIYPKDILTLVLAAEGETVPYMDLLIRQNRRRGLITAIYDKRLDSKYDNINVIRYPDRESVLANKAKCGIVTSQMYRFLRRCTRAADFVYNTSLVLHRLVLKSYHTGSLWAQIRRFITRFPNMYGRKTVGVWCDRVRAKLRDLTSGVCKPGPNGQIMSRGGTGTGTRATETTE